MKLAAVAIFSGAALIAHDEAAAVDEQQDRLQRRVAAIAAASAIQVQPVTIIRAIGDIARRWRSGSGGGALFGINSARHWARTSGPSEVPIAAMALRITCSPR